MTGSETGRHQAADGDRVGVVVDRDVCVGIGQCEMLQPDVFFIDDEAISTVADGATLDRSDAEAVVERCPSGAIAIVEQDAPT